MDFRFTPAQEAWRQEVGRFLDTLIPDWFPGVAQATVPPASAEEYAFTRQVHKQLAGRGWLVMSWPKEYGGLEAGVMDQTIFAEEYAYRRLPHLGPGVGFVGPSLAIHGSPEQKAKYLPPIAAAETVWCQGFSEPGTGSDLAGLQTKARADGDEMVVDGSKIWTTNAHRSDWCWLAVRTNPDAPKHRGISVLLVDMTSPGITVRPIHDIAGKHSFNQVYFDSVRVPRANLVGQINGGWKILTTTLDFERSSIATSAFARRTLEDLVRYANETIGPDGAPLGKDPIIAAKLAARATEIEVARLLAYRTSSVMASGRVPNKEASVSKLFGSMVLQQLAQTALDLAGPIGPVRKAVPGSALRRPVIDFCLNTISATIAGGSSEVQKGIIATRGLEMPR